MSTGYEPKFAMSNEAIGSSGIRPGKFNGKGNFSAWKFKTLAYLQSMDLKDTLVNSKSDIEMLMKEAGSSAEDTISKKGTFASDSSSGSTSAIEKSSSGGHPIQVLIRKSEKAYAILLNLLDDDLIDLIAHVEAGDAHRVWTVL